MKNKQEFLHQTAEIIKKLPDNCFQVKFNNGQVIKAKTIKRLKKLMVGDRVVVRMPLRDLNNGQIISLVKPNEFII